MSNLIRFISSQFSTLELFYNAKVKQYLPSTSGNGEKGQGLVEYALILVLVAIVVIVILALLGPAIGNVFSNIYCEVFYAGDGLEGTYCGGGSIG